MKSNTLFLFVIFTIVFANAFAQTKSTVYISNSKVKENKLIDIKNVPAPDLSFEKQKLSNEKNGTFLKAGVSIAVNFNMKNSGTWSDLENGTRTWELIINSKDAKALSLVYKNFKLIDGSELYLFNASKTQKVGPITKENNPNTELYSTEITQGETVILKLIEPQSTTEKSNIEIIEIAYIYKTVSFVEKFNPNKDTGWGNSESCEVNINCSPAGDSWQDEKRGVAEIFLRDNGMWGFCSGTLINNTKNDGTPYFLTADHCGGSTATTSDFSVWEFYFNYEATSCTTPTSEPTTSKTIIGCTKKAVGPINGGSDFLLVQLKSKPTATTKVFYNGWDRTNTAVTGGVGIHHPAGDIKKISYFSKKLVSASPLIDTDQTATNSEWQLTWSSTGNGTGVTEGGSSGSPLFNNSGLQIGTLSGGSSYCDDLTGADFYGKMWYHWDQNGTTNADRLKPWLDPTNSGVTSLVGYDPNATTIAPVAAFTSNITTIEVGSSVSFTDQSTNIPTSWLWTFAGGTPSSSTLQNPSVTYNTIGTYTVTLKATNAAGNNTITKNAYITVTASQVLICENITNFTGTATLYGVSSPKTGYMSGNNSYGDLSKAEFFNNYSPNTIIDKFLVDFAYASGSLSTITFNIRNQISNAPGNIISTSTLPISSIVSKYETELIEVDFSPNVTIPGPFYFEVVLPKIDGDTLAITTNSENDVTANTGWEKSINGTWSSYTDAWGISLNHKIYAVVCSSSSGIEDNTLTSKELLIYPNPAYNILHFELKNNDKNIEEISIYNIVGEKIDNFKFDFNKNAEINLNKYSLGAYFVKTIVSGETLISKIIIQK